MADKVICCIDKKSYIIFHKNYLMLNIDPLEEKKFSVMIVGAGVAGLSAAMELERNQENFVIIEKNNDVGGLAITYMVKEGDLEFRADNGPHLFSYGKKNALANFISSIIPKDLILHVKIRERLIIKGKTIDFPVIPIQMLRTYGYTFIIKALIEYFIAGLKYHILKKPITNFYTYIESNLGKTMAMTTTVKYLEKVFGIPATQLHINLAKQRFSFLSLSKYLREFLKNIIKMRKIGTDTENFNTDVIYSERGIGVFSEIIKSKVEHSGHPIFFNSYLTKLFHDNKHFTSAKVNINGQEIQFGLDYIIESIPIEDFVKLISPSAPKDVLEAAAKLPYRNQVYLFITLNADKLSNYHSIYFADKEIPFSRVSEMKNFDPNMSPPGKTSLLVEFFCNKEDQICNMTTEKLYQLALPFLERYCSFDKNMVRNYYSFPLDKAYPIYNLDYKKNLDIIMEYLNTFDNVFPIGRTGKFEYISMPRAIEMGLNAADAILGRRPKNKML